MTNIRITAFTDIGNNIAYSTLIPVVDMAGTPTTKKANLQIVGNLILNGAGGSYFAPAARSVLAQTVTNAAQPNITSVGTLTSLGVTGNVTAGNLNVSTGNVGAGNVNVTGAVYTNGISATGLASLTTLNVSTTANLGSVSNVTITGGTNGQVLTTNGSGGLSWTTVSSGSTYSNSNVASYLPTFTGTVGANRIASNTASGSNVQISANGAVFTFAQGGALYWPATIGNTWVIEPNIDNEFEIKSTSNVVISTDISNSNSHFTFDSEGIFRAPSNVVLSGTTLFIGPGAEDISDLANSVMVASSNSEAFIQAVITNVSDNGSADWIAQGHHGNDAGGYADLGFNSCGFSDPDYSATGPGDGYLLVDGFAPGQAPLPTGGNLVLGTSSQGLTRDIIFTTGGFTTANIFGRISDANNALELTRAGSVMKFADGSLISDNLEATGDFGVSTPANVGFMIETGGANAYTWTFGDDGVLTLANGNSTIQSVANSSLDPLNPNVSTMTLTPDQSYSYQALVLDPTAPGHIHLRGPSGTGNIDEPAANLFLGGENSSFEVGASYGGDPNVFVHSGGNTWTFSTDGNLVTPGLTGTYIKSAPGGYMGLAAIDDGGDQPAQLVSINSNSGLGTTAISAYANNAIIQANINGDIKSWNFDNAGNLTLPGNTFAVNYANGTQVPLGGGLPLANGTSNIDIATANGSVTLTAGGNTWTFDTSGQLSFPGNQGYMYSPGGSDLRILNNQNSGFLQLGWQDGAVLTPGANIASNVTLNSSGVTLTTTNDTFTTTNDWVFGITGTLTAPTNSIIQGTANLDIYSGDGNAIGGNLTLAAGTGNIGGDVGIFGGFGNVTDGGNVIIQGGVADSTGKGGNVEVRGGTGNIGGDILIAGGASTNVSPVTGNVEITGGNVIVKAWTFDDTGNLTFGVGNEPVIKWSTAPVSNTSEGYAGQAAYDSGGNLFVCVATNTWAKFSGTTSW